MNKKDFAYEITEVRQPSRYDVMRIAVLTPLMGTEWVVGGAGKAAADAGVIEAMDKLRRMWYMRLLELHKAGWSALHGKPENQFSYLRNCPPFGVKTNTNYMRCCNQVHVCPFCYARERVFEPYMHFERLLYADSNPRTLPQTDGWKLVECRISTRLEAETDLDYEAAFNLHKIFLGNIQNPERRRREREICQAPYGVMQYHVEPAGKRTLRLTRSGVYLTRKKVLRDRVVFNEKDHFVYQDLGEVTEVKKTLALAVGRTFAYPKQMMYGPAAPTVGILHALHRVRMMSTYGFRRNPEYT